MQSLLPISEDMAVYGLAVNAISTAELFQHYKDLNFLYPAKLQRLAPVLGRVEANWNKMLGAGDELLRICTTGRVDDQENGWGSISGWRTSMTGWFYQHLVSTGNPINTARCLLGVQAWGIHNPEGKIAHVAFQPANRFASKVYGSLVNSIDPNELLLHPFCYYSVKRETLAYEAAIEIATGSNDARSVVEFCRNELGSVFVAGEELESDFDFSQIDALYSRHGLRRYRKVFAVKTGKELHGIALCYRAPMGLNFSFIENRCVLIPKSGLSAEQRTEVLQRLAQQAKSEYADYENPEMLLATPGANRVACDALGWSYLRTYNQCTWLEPGFEDWYQHVESFFIRIERAQARRRRQEV